MSLITRTQAKDMIHELTGRSIAWSKQAVGEMAKVQDGARKKVCLRDVQIVIEKENTPPEPAPEIKFHPKVEAKLREAMRV